MKFKRIIWIVLDSVGIGAMPDAAAYGDFGSNTLGNVAKRRPMALPNLCRMGLAKIKNIPGLCRANPAAAAYGKCALASPGKDTTTGHWEMAGVILEKPFPVYPHGFPAEIMAEFERQSGRSAMGNKPASGTEIIEELGEEHMRSGSPIVYTSADSVFQIAAHEEIIPVEELYRYCEIARNILRGSNEVGRVIARPFVGQPGSFRRTANRHDYAVPPPAGMLLDRLHDQNVPVYAVGKIADIFLNRGVSHSEKTSGNGDGMSKTCQAMRDQRDGLIFVNLVDFDSLYGHRNDVEGYARALEAVDRWLPDLDLQPADMLILTADHGCDPTTPSTDHSREYTPLLVYGQQVRGDVALGTRHSLADIGATVAENFKTTIKAGNSFLSDIQTL